MCFYAFLLQKHKNSFSTSNHPKYWHKRANFYIQFCFIKKRIQMQTVKNKKSAVENTTTPPVVELTTNENTIATDENIVAKTENESLQTPTIENTTTPVENTPPQTANNNDTTENEEEVVVKKANRVAYNCHLTVDEDLHVQTIINDLIKFKVVENKADFIRKAIDVYCNYNNVCSELKYKQPLILPVPDGKDGSVAITPKLLKNSLFKSVSTIQSF